MLFSLVRLIKKNRGKKSSGHKPEKGSLFSEKPVKPVSASLTKNLEFIKQLLAAPDDLIIGEIEILGGRYRAGLVYMNGLTDQDIINDHILAPLRGAADKDLPRRNKLAYIKDRLLTTVGLNKITGCLEEVIEAVLVGDTVLFLEGSAKALICLTKKSEKRAIEKPETEVTVLGGKEGFTEVLATNIAMLRRRLPTPDLRFEKFVVGSLSRTNICLAWLEGIANPKIIEEARRRLQRIDVDYVTGTSMIVEFIEDNPYSIWAHNKMTERPDIAAANMAEGRFCLFCDGVPYVMMAPALFWQNIQTVDDYGERWLVGTFFRLIRQVAFYISLAATPLFVAVVSYHQAIIPPCLAQRMAYGRGGVPFPTLLEALVLTMAIDLLREAGVRLPRAIGPAVGILGAVVIGQAAVLAGFVSPSIIIVISISAISSFAIPDNNLSNVTRMLNYFLIVLGGVLGLFGVIWGMIFLLWGLVSLRSFGVPVFYPVAPREPYALKDILLRLPRWQRRRRPSLLAPDNQIRVGPNSGPPRPGKREGSRGR